MAAYLYLYFYRNSLSRYIYAAWKRQMTSMFSPMNTFAPGSLAIMDLY
jgi:hypothetical protein